MTTPTFTPPITPSPGLETKPEIKLLKADFGDGYSQPTRDGLNHIRSVVRLRWDVLTLAERDEIESFLIERGGDRPFLYTVPGSLDAVKWTCEEWTVTNLAVGHYSIDATFRQDHRL